MADQLKARIALLQIGEAQGKLKPEHKRELDAYRAKGLAQAGSDSERRQAQKALLAEQQEADAASANVATLNEFEGINNRLRPRGGLLDHAAHVVQGWMGNTDLARLRAITSKMALQQHKPGSGPQSDRDLQVQQGIVGSEDKPYEANKKFVEEQRRLNQSVIDKHQFRDSYVKAHGSLVGSDAAYANKLRSAPPSTRKSPAAHGWTVEEVK
ncbi:hypothetical protein ABIC16_003716 [Sphingomonas sp. PvP055]|uniref:hypothetical protein n=1 Tax=Sphingomonas sp. PvP055 TaxID=3156391 RepID=UPI003391BA37